MKLHIKKDGTLYMKRPVPGIGWTTWQVTPDGVDLLARKRVNVGDEIPEKVFDELLRKNYLYTGGSGPGDEVELFGSSRSRWLGGRKSKKGDELDAQGCLMLVGLFLVSLFLIKVYEFLDGLF